MAEDTFFNLLELTGDGPEQASMIIRAILNVYRLYVVMHSHTISVDIDGVKETQPASIDPFVTIVSSGMIIHAAKFWFGNGVSGVETRSAAYANGDWTLGPPTLIHRLSAHKCALCKIPAEIWNRALINILTDHQPIQLTNVIICDVSGAQILTVPMQQFRKYCRCEIRDNISPTFKFWEFTPECREIIAGILFDTPVNIRTASITTMRNVIAVMARLQMKI